MDAPNAKCLNFLLIDGQCRGRKGKKQKQISPAHVLLTMSPPSGINLPSSPIQQQDQVEDKNVVTHRAPAGSERISRTQEKDKVLLCWGRVTPGEER